MLGAEKVYTRVLLSATNGSLNVINKGAHIELEEITGMKEHYQFKVNAVIGGRTGSYPQKIGGMLQPFVIILTWQIFLFFILTPKTALRAFLINVGLFILIQIFFLILLTNYYSSDSARYIYTMLLDSFYIVALILIIKDNMMYNIFTKKSDNSYK